MFITWKNVEGYVNECISPFNQSPAQRIFEQICSELETDYLDCSLISGEWYLVWNNTLTLLSSLGATIRGSAFVAF